MYHGAGRLARCETKTGKAVKTQALNCSCIGHRPRQLAWIIDRQVLDPRLLLRRLRTSTASHHAPRGWLPCPLRSGNRQGGKNTGPQLLLYRLRTSTALAWLIDGQCWTLDCSCLCYGLRLLAWLIDGQRWTLDCSCIGYGLRQLAWLIDGQCWTLDCRA